MQVSTSMSKNPTKKNKDRCTSAVVQSCGNRAICSWPTAHSAMRAKKHQIDDRRNERQHQLKHKNIGQRNPAQRAVFGPQQRVAVLPERLQRAEGPAKSLANQRPGSFWSFGPGNSVFVIADAPAQRRMAMVRSASSATVSEVIPPAASMASVRHAPSAPGTTVMQLSRSKARFSMF